MQTCAVVVLVSISFVVLPTSFQLENDRDRYGDNGWPPKFSGNEEHSLYGAKEEVLEPVISSLEASDRGENVSIANMRLSRGPRGRGGSRSQGRPSQRKKPTPEERLRKMTDKLFRRLASFKIPKGYVLPFCFKDTALKDELKKMSSSCDRMGVDWPCVFAQLAGGDSGFSMKTLASKFDEVVEKSLHRGLQSAIVACDEYWQQYKHEERRRLLLQELESEVISRTWVERGQAIGEPYKPKRRAEDTKNLTDPAAIRRALLDAGFADYSVEPISNRVSDNLSSTSRFQRRSSQSSNVSPPNVFTKSKRTPGNGAQRSHEKCLNRRFSAHPWRERSRKSISCMDSSLVVDGESLDAVEKLIQESSNIETEFLCPTNTERCRRDNTMLDRIKQEREKKRQEVLKRKELREEAQKRIEELMKQGGGGEELQAILATSKEDPEIESKLGQHLEREERIEEDLRSQVSSCITEEATKLGSFQFWIKVASKEDRCHQVYSKESSSIDKDYIFRYLQF